MTTLFPRRLGPQGSESKPKVMNLKKILRDFAEHFRSTSDEIIAAAHEMFRVQGFSRKVPEHIVDFINSINLQNFMDECVVRQGLHLHAPPQRALEVPRLRETPKLVRLAAPRAPPRPARLTL